MYHKILILQRRLPVYRLSFFEQLRQELKDMGVDLALVVGEPAQEELSRNDEGQLDWAVRLPTRYLALAGKRAVWISLSRKMALNYDLLILPHENNLLSNYQQIIGRTKTLLGFWGHGANFQARRQIGFGAGLRNWSARQADWWFAYTQRSVERLQEIGVNRERITCLNNAVDTQQLRRWYGEITQVERTTLLSHLGLKGEKVGIALGSLHGHRRLPFLYAAADEIRHRLPDFELIIIGDGPERAGLESWAQTRSWVQWVGARQGREKVLYSSLGHCLLNPGMVGLNILDGFALGLPLMTTDCGIHSPEIAYLVPGCNGEITSDSVTEYSTAVVRMLSDKSDLSRLSGECFKSANIYTEKAMIENFAAGIQQALTLR